MLKLFQIMAPVKNCDVLLSCREDILDILKHMIIWKSDWRASKLGWQFCPVPSRFVPCGFFPPRKGDGVGMRQDFRPTPRDGAGIGLHFLDLPRPILVPH